MVWKRLSFNRLRHRNPFSFQLGCAVGHSCRWRALYIAVGLLYGSVHAIERSFVFHPATDRSTQCRLSFTTALGVTNTARPYRIFFRIGFTKSTWITSTVFTLTTWVFSNICRFVSVKWRLATSNSFFPCHSGRAYIYLDGKCIIPKSSQSFWIVIEIDALLPFSFFFCLNFITHARNGYTDP